MYTEYDVEYMEYELERYRSEERDRQEQEQLRREERAGEWKEEREMNLRTASTWPETLSKQAMLFSEEASLWWRGENNEFPDDFFGPGAKACERAIEIWKEVEASKQEKIAKLKAELDAIQDEIRIETSQKLASEDNRQGWRSVASAIEENDDLNNWLYW